MLRGVSRWLAARSAAVTVTGRRAERLVPLADEFANLAPVAFDWRDADAARRSVEHALKTRGPCDLAVLWVHDSGARALDAIVETLVAHADAASSTVRLVHVLGSSADDPNAFADDAKPELLRREAPPRSVRYEQVVLGFMIEDPPRGGGGSGVSRWLTNDEISAGVIDAIERPSIRTTVGLTRPWGRRPGM